jgi:hypothetical protein
VFPEELDMVVSADNALLVKMGKIDKHASKGGDEDLYRPIQSRYNMNLTANDVEPRLLDLASLPFVDMVFSGPSPIDGIAAMLATPNFLAELMVKRGTFERKFREAFFEIEGHNPENLEKVVEAGRRMDLMIEDILNFNGENTIIEFTSVPYVDQSTLEIWDRTAWNGIVHLFLGMKSTPKRRVIRVLNTRDSDYFDVVAAMTKAVGMDYVGLTSQRDWSSDVSTSSLVQEEDLRTQLDVKLDHYLRSLGRHK